MKRATSWGRRHVAVMHMPSGRQHKENFLHRLHGVLKELEPVGLFNLADLYFRLHGWFITCLDKLLQGKLR